MGNNSSKRPNRTYQSSVKVSVPNLVYINRNTKELLTSISHDISLAILKQKAKVYRNSAVSCLDDGTLIIAGGSDSSCSLTNKVFMIYAYQKTVTELPLLPVPIKFGQFCRSHDYLYCLGGLSEPEDNDSSQVEEASPFMRYSFESKTWEVFKHKHNKTPGHLLRRKIISVKDKLKPSVFLTDCPLLKDLIFPAVGYFDGKIYTFGGKIAVEEGFEVIDKIFSIQVKDDDLSIIEESFVLPVKISAAACQIKGKKCFLAGGLLENSKPNMEIFVVNFDGKYVSKLGVDIDSPLEDHYPIIADDKGILCYSPPKLLYVREDKSKLYHFTMPPKDSLNAIDLVVEKKSNERSPYHKVFVDLSLVTISKNDIMARMSMQPNMTGNDKNDMIQRKGSGNINQNPFIRSKTIGSQVKVIVAECDSGHRLVKNPYDKRIKCNHCLKSTRNNWVCQGCEFHLCEDCSKALCDYKRFVGTMLKCSQGHYFSKPKHETSQSSSSQCLNCNETLSNLSLYCFLCQEHLCSSCESSLLKQISTPNLYNCPSSHRLEPILSSELCNFCTKNRKGVLKYTCKNCKLYYCIVCTELLNKPKTLDELKETCKEPAPKNIDIMLKNDKNKSRGKNIKDLAYPKSLSLESSNNGKANHAETEPISPVNPQDSKVENAGNKSVLIKKPVPITNDELMKRLLKKPVRGTKSPFFLNLSPAKTESLGRHSISHIATVKYESFFDIKDSETTSKLNIFEVPQKVLHNSSNEPSIYDRPYAEDDKDKLVEENFDMIGKRVENCELNEEYVSDIKDIIIFNENELKKNKDLKDAYEKNGNKEKYDGFNRDYENNIVLSRASYDIPMHHDKKISETDIFLKHVLDSELNHKRNGSNKVDNPQVLNQKDDYKNNISFSDNSLSGRQKKEKSREKKSKGSKNHKPSIESFKFSNDNSSQSSEEFEIVKAQIKHTKVSAIKNENLPQEEESSYSISSSVQSSVKKQESDIFPVLAHSKKSSNFVENSPLKPEKKLKFYEEREKAGNIGFTPRARIEEKKVVNTGKFDMENVKMKNFQLANKNFEEVKESSSSESEVFLLECQNEDIEKGRKDSKKESSESLSSNDEDNEDVIAPVIEERFAEDKIKALMEKMLVIKRESSSSSEESAKKNGKNKRKLKNKSKNHSKSPEYSEKSLKKGKKKGENVEEDKKKKKAVEDDKKKQKSKEKLPKKSGKSSGEKKPKPMGFAFIMGNPQNISRSSEESSESFVEAINPYKKNLEVSSISKDESIGKNYTGSSHTSSSEFFFDEA